MLLQFETAILTFDVLHVKPSRRFLESRRRIDTRVPGSRFSDKFYLYCNLLGDMIIFLKNIPEEPWIQLLILLQEPQIQLPILFGDSKNLQEVFAL
jgi:hypothetical protein